MNYKKCGKNGIIKNIHHDYFFFLVKPDIWTTQPSARALTWRFYKLLDLAQFTHLVEVTEENGEGRSQRTLGTPQRTRSRDATTWLTPVWQHRLSDISSRRHLRRRSFWKLLYSTWPWSGGRSCRLGNRCPGGKEGEKWDEFMGSNPFWILEYEYVLDVYIFSLISLFFFFFTATVIVLRCLLYPSVSSLREDIERKITKARKWRKVKHSKFYWRYVINKSS